jgi:group I intron endonuclease
MNNNFPHFNYIITSNFDDKVYIGTTYKSIEERLKEHYKKSKSNKRNYLHNAIRKYGIENFNIKLLAIFDNKKDAYVNETVLIKELNSKAPLGYNETDGGDCGPLVIRLSQELINNVLIDFCNNISMKDISIKYNISKSSVFDITRLRFSKTHKVEQGLLETLQQIKAKSNKKKRMTKENIVYIFELYQTKTMAEISELLGFCINTIWNVLHKNVGNGISSRVV